MHIKNEILIMLFLVISVTVLNSVSASANSTDLNDGNLILLKAEHINTDNYIEPEENVNNIQSQEISIMSIETTENYYIVQFTGPVRESWKQEITSTGATIYGYVPNNAFIFKMSDSVKAQAESKDFVKWIGEYRPSYKYEPELAYTNSIQITSAENNTEKTYNVLLFSSEDYERIAGSIESFGGNVISGPENTLKIHASAEILLEIASINGVSWIEEYIQPTVNNDVAANITNAYTVHNTLGLNGSGQIVAIADSGLDNGEDNNYMHADIRERILSIKDLSNGVGDEDPADYSGHGTHVAGSVLGNGSLSNGKYSGMAPEAELVFQALGDSSGSGYLYPPNDLNDLFQEAYDLGARIHTNSWGDSVYGGYTLFSKQVDQFMWEYPDMLILFAAGNSGVDSNKDGVIDKDSIAAPGTAKNCLTVGASESERGNTFGSGKYLNWGYAWPTNYPAFPIYEDYMANDSDGIAAFSSRGPTDDGRIKPDVVAPGTFIISTRSSIEGSTSGWGIIDDNYLYMGGTSMATPITAGSAVLVREYYTDIEGLDSPSAALLKATIINGAINLTPGQYDTDHQEINRRPDYSQGWGRVDVENSIHPQYPDVIEYFDNPEPLDDDPESDSYNPKWNVSYNVTENSETLRATLVWTDHYNTADAADRRLVNNLDLTIIGPDDDYYGNYELNDAPDTVNNVEGIELINPTAGTYTIIVNGTAIQIGQQNFSLVVYSTFDVNECPQNSTFTTNNSTVVSLNLTHPYGVNQSSINMKIDGSEVPYSLESITGGYMVENMTVQPYSEGYHNVYVTALTNKTEEMITYEWQFYASVEENVITIEGLEENSVIQEETLEINISNKKLCDFRYNIDGESNIIAKAGFSSNVTLNITEGQHNITVFAEDITGFINSANVNFTVFTSQPIIDSPESGTIYYIPTSNFSMNGSAGVATNISVYVNGNLTNESLPVANSVFNLSNIPLSNGINMINVTSIFNNSKDDYISSNTTIYLSVGKKFNTEGNDEVTLSVPGIGSNISNPVISFNITGTPSNPGNLLAAVVKGEEPGSESSLVGDAIDIRENEDDESYQFDRNVSLTLGYDHNLVDSDTEKLTVAWYNTYEETWIPFRSTVNTSAHTVTTNITHLSIYAPLEDNTAPVISNLAHSSTASSITLTWDESEDTDHVEVWRNEIFLANYSASKMTNTGLSASTSYSYTLRPIDYVGNIGTWTNTAVTTSSANNDDSPSSSGGGGGGGSTGEDYENIAFKDVLTAYAGKEEVVDFDFTHEKDDIDYVRYLSLKNAGKISVTIEVLNNNSTFAKSAAPGIVYKNINIWVGKTGYATKDNIKDPEIGFRVYRGWILDNGIDPSSIKLQRFSGGEWEKLSTEFTGSNEDYLYFEAKTPGFSPFAITGERTGSHTENFVNGTILLEEEGEAGKVSSAEEKPGPDHDSAISHIMIFAYAAFAGLLITIAYLHIRKQQN